MIQLIKRLSLVHGFAALALVACDSEPASSSSPDGGKADDPQDPQDPQDMICAFNPFSPDQPELEGLNGGLEPFNTDFSDFASEIRDQGTVASCASHTILALLENEMFNNRGITLDLSERYLLYANFMSSQDMGTNPAVIRQFPTILAEYGLMPESLWPYSVVLDNAHRFGQDAAQNLGAAESEEPTVDEAIASASCGPQRSDILQQDIYLGPLPEDDRPIRLPILAQYIAEGARMTEFQDLDTQQRTECFTDDPNQVGTGPGVSPRDFLRLCFDFQPKEYFSCIPFSQDVEALESVLDQLVGGDGELFEDAELETVCANKEQVATDLSDVLHGHGKSMLALTLHLTEQGQAVFVGVASPQQGGVSPVWYTRLPPGGGHAVAVVGHLTAAELQEAEEHGKGLLAQGTFDELAAAYDALLPADAPGTPFAGVSDDDSLEVKTRKRVESRLGQKVIEEGGILLFRNSWGQQSGGVNIGAQGYQSMTFKYFTQRSQLILSRRHPAIKDAFIVDGQVMDGPLFCPADFDRILHEDPWVLEDHTADFRAVADGVLGLVRP